MTEVQILYLGCLALREAIDRAFGVEIKNQLASP